MQNYAKKNMDEKEHPLALSDLAKEIERKGYGAKSHCQLRRYADSGVKVFPDSDPIKLECWRINGKLSSSVAAYERFIVAQMDAQRTA